jgi:cobalt/nickel transport system permease protein
VLIAQFIYRYLFVISEQAQHMLQASRCRAPRGRPRGGFHAAAGALAVLFAQSYRRAEGIQNAMLARGFTGTFPALGSGRFQAADALFAVSAAGCIVALRVGAGA